MRRFSLCCIVLIGLLGIAPRFAHSDVVVSNSPADFETVHGAARWRSFGNSGGDELYLGVGDLGNAANRVAQGFTWPAGDTSISLSFDSSTQMMSATVGAQQALTFNISDPGNMNLMQIAVADRESNGTIEFNDVFLNGESLGDFGGTGGWDIWSVSNFNFSQDWALTGNINLSGTFSNSQETSKLDITFGRSTIPEPSTLGILLVGGIGVLVRRRVR